MTTEVRRAYCPSCGWVKEPGGLKEANAHNQVCPVQRPEWMWQPSGRVTKKREDFQWYPGWEKEWEEDE